MLYYRDLLVLLPAILFALWAQSRVNGAYRRFSRVRAGMTGWEAAQMVLDRNGVTGVSIQQVAGQLTDHYDPRENVIRLSQGVFDADTVAAVGVAAHEAGHAVQYALGYTPIRLRSAIIPVTQLGSTLSWPLLLIGILLGSETLALAGVILFLAVVLFQLVTLPVEFNASNRAMAALDASGRFTESQLDGSAEVLRAAAMTYVAALATSIAQLLRLLMIFGGGRRRND